MLYILSVVCAVATLRQERPRLMVETFSLRRSTKSNKLLKQAKNPIAATPATFLFNRFLVVFTLRDGSAIIIFNFCEDGVITTNHACSEFELKTIFDRMLIPLNPAIRERVIRERGKIRGMRHISFKSSWLSACAIC